MFLWHRGVSDIIEKECSCDLRMRKIIVERKEGVILCRNYLKACLSGCW